MAENRTERVHAEIFQRLAAARQITDTDTYRFLVRVQEILWQFEAVTPRTPAYLPCQWCGTTGRTKRPLLDENSQPTSVIIEVLCHYCQGSGRTWNPNPRAWFPTVKGEL